MLELLVVGAWLGLAAYGAWLLSAKEQVPLSPQDVSFLWKVHKRDNQCRSTKFKKLKHKGEIIGFECGCGYKLVSQRLITQKPYTRICATLSEENNGRKQQSNYSSLTDIELLDRRS